MQIEISEIEYCKLNVHYEADLTQIDNKKVEVISHFKRAPVPGFRQGKATIEAIKVHYKNQIKESLKRALAEDAYHNTIFEKNIKPFGQPNFTSMFLSDNKFSCDFSLNKKPDFELAEYKNLEFPKQEVGFTILELSEKMLENLRKQQGTTVPFTENDFVQMRDNVVIDYDCFDEETKVESVCATGELLTVGESKLPGFDENLLGMKLNETRTFYIKAPEGGLPSLEGKEIKFIITVVNGSKSTPMPLGDELAKKVGKENFEELNKFIHEISGARYQEAQKNANIKQLSARLVADNDVKIPSWLTLSEAQYLTQNAGVKWDVLADQDKEKYFKMAESNVKLALVLDKIRENEPDAQLTDEEILNMIKQTLAKSKNQKEIDSTLIELNKSGYLSVLAARMKDEHTLDFVFNNCKIVE